MLSAVSKKLNCERYVSWNFNDRDLHVLLSCGWYKLGHWVVFLDMTLLWHGLSPVPRSINGYYGSCSMYLCLWHKYWLNDHLTFCAFLTLSIPDLIRNSPYCLSYNSHDLLFKIWYWIKNNPLIDPFFLILITCLLDTTFILGVKEFMVKLWYMHI